MSLLLLLLKLLLLLLQVLLQLMLPQQRLLVGVVLHLVAVLAPAAWCGSPNVVKDLVRRY